MNIEELNSLVSLLEVDLVQEKTGIIKHYNMKFPVNPLLTDEFRQFLKTQAVLKNHEIPHIYQDIFGVFYACFDIGQSWYFIGPMSVSVLPQEVIKSYLSHYQVAAQPFSLKTFELHQVLQIVGLLSSQLGGKFWQSEELLVLNQQLIMKPKLAAYNRETESIRTEEVELAHHTYREERNLLEYVKRGAVDEALAIQSAMDQQVGKLSRREITHWRNLVIVAITLSTRAAIEGGLDPATAYRISDTYIQKCDSEKTVDQLKFVRNQAVQELTEQVSQKLLVQSQTNYIKAATSYIDRHYRNKIYLEDVADYVGLSASYFSKLFKKEVGLSFQHYVTRVRLEYAANLLRFSNESISVISEYVNFPSQSYFGHYFKEHYHMTPKEYRDLYHITDGF